MSEQSSINLFGRQTGRTSAMLHRAIAYALEGKTVLVVAATISQAMQMSDTAMRMEKPLKANRSNLQLDYWRGSVRFTVFSRDTNHTSGHSGKVLVDHYVMEKYL